MYKESAPNFSLIVDSEPTPEEQETQEFHLEQISPEKKYGKFSALFNVGNKTEEQLQIQKPYFDLIESGMHAAADSKSKKGSEIIMADRSKPFAELEVKLLILLAPLTDLIKNKEDCDVAITKLKRNYQQERPNAKFDSNIITDHFPKGVGLFSALNFYRSRNREKLPQNFHREIYLQPQLDAKAEADFIEVIYQKDGDDIVSIEELNLVQVKSSQAGTNIPKTKAKHAALGHELSNNLETINERYFPEVTFDDEEQMLDIYAKIIGDMVKNQANVKGNEDAIDRGIKLVKKATEKNGSNNSPMRLEANMIVQLASLIEDYGGEDGKLALYQLVKTHVSRYTDIKAAHLVKEMKRRAEMLPENSESVSAIIELASSKIPEKTYKAALTPKPIPIKKINSFTTVGAKIVDQSAISLSNTPYLVKRSS